MTAELQNLKDLPREELRAFLKGLDQPAYRGDQVFEWIYVKGATAFETMSNLPKALRERLAEVATLRSFEIAASPKSVDGTRKLLLRLQDGASIEAVLIPDETRMTLCVSTQVGCALGCKFCATGVLGFSRNLTPAEIVDQFLIAEKFAREDRAEAALAGPSPEAAARAKKFLSRLGSSLGDEEDGDGTAPAEEGAFDADGGAEPSAALAPARPRDPNDPAPRGITNVVLMGMGEPLLNAEAVAKALKILSDPKGLAFSRHRVTLSTVGILPKLWPFLEETGVNLAVSLHAPNPAIRADLMPIDKAYGMTELLDSIRARQETMKDRVTFEYVLLDGVNDAPEHARELAGAIRGIRGKVNLLPFNPYEGAPYARPADDRVERFRMTLRIEGVDAFIRKSRGRDIAAACGQLALHDREQSTIIPLSALRKKRGEAPLDERAALDG